MCALSRIFCVIRFSHVSSCRDAHTWKFGRSLCGWKSLGTHLHPRILSRLVTLPLRSALTLCFFTFLPLHFSPSLLSLSLALYLSIHQSIFLFLYLAFSFFFRFVITISSRKKSIRRLDATSVADGLLVKIFCRGEDRHGILSRGRDNKN